jgi:nitrite reductase/ring-hydroxylating ferredoxin subunit
MKLRRPSPVLDESFEEMDMSFAASWYALARSADITTRPTRLTRFAQPLVAWRDRDGRAAVMADACPHFGASLAQGHVDGDGCLVCPFHRWRFSHSGTCVAIPGSDVIPQTAHRQPLTTVERYGLVWAFWGSPTPLFTLPDLPQLDEAALRSVLAFTVATPLAMVLANSYDVRHLVETHRTAGTTRARIHGDAGATITPDGLDPSAWCGAELELDPARMSVREVLAGIFAEGTPFGLATTLSGYLGTWALTRSGIRSVRTMVSGWPTGHYTRVYLNGALSSSVLTSGCPIDETQSIVFSVNKQAAQHGPVADFLAARFARLQVRQAIATDLVILNQLDIRSIGVFVREDRPTLAYLKLHDRFVSRVDVAWLAARSGTARPRDADAHPGHILRTASPPERARAQPTGSPMAPPVT